MALQPKRATIVLAALVAALASGCVRLAGGILAFAPNCGQSIQPRDDPSARTLEALGVDLQLRIDVGPPHASLYLWILEPHVPEVAGALAPRGTILLLHGIRRTRRDMLGLGRSLAAAGYRCVLVDLRGHGRSSGERLTYGVVEKIDLSQVLDGLGRRGLLALPVAACGYSYGGAAAIEHAAIDARVEASSLTRADLAAAQPLAAVRSRAVPLLLVHGADDRLLRVEHSEVLLGASLGPGALLILRGVGHNDVFRKALEPVARETILWLDRWLDRDRTTDRKDSP
jgi:pimeloyl-ACP methyl ester carboxylesterase